MLIVAGHGRVEPHRRAALLAGLQDGLRHARAEPGCLDYVVAADPVEPDRVVVYERWESARHLDQHLAAVARIAPPMEGVLSVDVTRYEITASGPVPM